MRDRLRPLDAEATVVPQPLNDQATDLLRRAIVCGQIPRGAKLVEAEVAARLRAGRAPVRDALLRLEGEGLVVRRGKWRHVLALSRQDLIALHEVRQSLELTALRLGIPRATPEQHALLAAHGEEFHALAEAQDRSAYAFHDLAFHEALWTISGNPFLMRAAQPIAGPIIMTMLSPLHVDSAWDWAGLRASHDDLIASILRRDYDAAEHLMAEHIAHSLREILAWYDHPSPD